MLLSQLSPSDIRVFIVSILFLIVGFQITSCIILWLNYKQTKAKSTLAIFYLFGFWMVSNITLIFGFGARVQTETPAQLDRLLLTIAAGFVVELLASINFMLVLYCKPMRRAIRNIRKLFDE